MARRQSIDGFVRSNEDRHFTIIARESSKQKTTTSFFSPFTAFPRLAASCCRDPKIRLFPPIPTSPYFTNTMHFFRTSNLSFLLLAIFSFVLSPVTAGWGECWSTGPSFECEACNGPRTCIQVGERTRLIGSFPLARSAFGSINWGDNGTFVQNFFVLAQNATEDVTAEQRDQQESLLMPPQLFLSVDVEDDVVIDGSFEYILLLQHVYTEPGTYFVSYNITTVSGDDCNITMGGGWLANDMWVKVLASASAEEITKCQEEAQFSSEGGYVRVSFVALMFLLLATSTYVSS